VIFLTLLLLALVPLALMWVILGPVTDGIGVVDWRTCTEANNYALAGLIPQLHDAGSTPVRSTTFSQLLSISKTIT